MNKSVRNILMSLIISIAVPVFIGAQDIHFSQNSFAPLQLNPGLAGLDDINVYAGYRNQWRRAGAPFRTIYSSVESPISFKRKNSLNKLGVGIDFYNDVSGSPEVSNTQVNLHLSYHLFLSKYSSLSGSIYGGYKNMKVSFDNGKWASQHNGWFYNSSLESGESLIGQSTNAMDVGTGFVFTQRKKNAKAWETDAKLFQAGVAFYHVNQPNLSMLNDDAYKLPVRTSAFVKANIGLGKKFLLTPQFYLQSQRPFSQVLLGTNIRYNISEKLKNTSMVSDIHSINASLGVFYRSNDALILNALFEYTNYAISISFDITTSDFQGAVQSRGATEIMLRYRLSRRNRNAIY